MDREKKRRWKRVSEMTPSELLKRREQKLRWQKAHVDSLSSDDRQSFLAKRREREIPVQREWRQSHREETNAEVRSYYWKDPDKVRARQKRYRQAEKREVVSRYGGLCACCGENELVFLTIDHIYGDGKEHRSTDRSATLLYRWLKKNGYPDGFQVLCWNCNTAKRRLSACPHESLLKERFVLLRNAVFTKPQRGGVT